MLEREDKLVSWCGNGQSTPKAKEKLVKSKFKLLKWLWKWLGFQDKTFWDWMHLLLVPGFILGATVFFNLEAEKRQNNLNLEAEKRENALSIERKKQEVVQNYLSKMTELISSGQLIDPGNMTYRQTSIAAKALTQSALRDIKGDGDRKRQILEFLYDAQLVTYKPDEQESIINMAGIKLNEANLESLSFSLPINLSKADLSKAKLKNSFLKEANLTGAWLTESDLRAANLENAKLIRANLKGAKLIGANLEGADLSHADLSRANLTSASLGEKPNTIVHNAKLNSATLVGANLRGADLTDADLNGADLTNADLTDAKIKTANVVNATLCNTTMSGGIVDYRSCPEKAQ